MAENNPAGVSAAHSRANASVRSRALGKIPSTLQALNSFRTEERRMALTEAVCSFDEGLVVRPQDTGWVNVLARTFFSYSVDGNSPSRLAWEAVIRGLSVIGCADIDNLGALGEMQTAGDALAIRTTVSLITRVYVQSYSDRAINCPGQPGVLQAMGVGFTSMPSLDCDHGCLIAALPTRARDRNVAMLEKINPMLAPVSLDYEQDVVPLTPAGNATTEHIAQAYIAKAKTIFPEVNDQAVFWADVLGRSPTDIECLLEDNTAFTDAFWEKLLVVSHGDPVPRNYPNVTEFFQAVKAAGAIPCLFWSGGGLEGEADPDRLLTDACQWGARAVAIVPDNSWNIADPAKKESRLAALAAFMTAAKSHNMPVLAGSPMNAPRQKFVDSFDAPELAAYFRDFTDSAFWLYGHATLERALGLGLTSEWAEHAFAGDPAAVNAFYLEVGKKAAPGKTTRARIANACHDDGATPGDILDALKPLKI